MRQLAAAFKNLFIDPIAAVDEDDAKSKLMIHLPAALFNALKIALQHLLRMHHKPSETEARLEFLSGFSLVCQPTAAPIPFFYASQKAARKI
jgi:hypothetical protein